MYQNQLWHHPYTLPCKQNNCSRNLTWSTKTINQSIDSNDLMTYQKYIFQRQHRQQMVTRTTVMTTMTMINIYNKMNEYELQITDGWVMYNYVWMKTRQMNGMESWNECDLLYKTNSRPDETYIITFNLYIFISDFPL